MILFQINTGNNQWFRGGACTSLFLCAVLLRPAFVLGFFFKVVFCMFAVVHTHLIRESGVL